MIRIDIRPVWRFRSGDAEREFDFQLLRILEQVEATSKLTAAAESADISYRHAWNLVTDWERFFAAPLVEKAQGRGSRLTPLGRRLLAAGRRAQARLAPELENFAAQFERTVNASMSGSASTLAIHASHDFAVAALRGLAAEARLPVELQYKGSFDALAALRRGDCDVAGFHLPEGPMGSLMARRYEEALPLREYRLIAFVEREQGFIVRAGNPKAIGSVRDLCRQDVRMVNRQRGSGTRALLEYMITTEGLERSLMHGYDDEEITHAAVAAMIAGGQVDAGFGVRAAAEHYRLGFVPVCNERYFLACRADEIATPAFAALIALLHGDAFREAVAALPGYSAANAGEILDSFGQRAPARS